MIAVIDYGRGNLFSIGQALLKLNFEFVITEDPDVAVKADRILLPGVGAFGDAMEGLRGNAMNEALITAAAEGKQILGICLGMQLLASQSEEFGVHSGLGLIAGNVGLLSPPRDEQDTRIPNMGWRKVEARNAFGLLESIDQEPYFYFVHSYAFRCSDDADVFGVIAVNGESIPAIVGHDNVWGVQFHPEKSGLAGLRLLDSFFRSYGPDITKN